jgi:hypothetical protein
VYGPTTQGSVIADVTVQEVREKVSKNPENFASVKRWQKKKQRHKRKSVKQTGQIRQPE